MVTSPLIPRMRIEGQRRGRQPPCPTVAYGPLMHAMLHSPIVLQVPCSELRDATNPRAFLPIQTCLGVLRATKSKDVASQFTEWLQHFHFLEHDEERRRRDADELLLRFLQGSYAWIPALAHVISKAPLTIIKDVMSQYDFSFKPNTSVKSDQEIAVIKECALRCCSQFRNVVMSVLNGDLGDDLILQILVSFCFALKGQPAEFVTKDKAQEWIKQGTFEQHIILTPQHMGVLEMGKALHNASLPPWLEEALKQEASESHHFTSSPVSNQSNQRS